MAPDSFIGDGSTNTIVGTSGVPASFSAISGGASNLIQTDHSFIGCGELNKILTSSDHSIIGGGKNNLISASIAFGTIGGGELNVLDTGGDHEVIGGGLTNRITNGTMSTIGGGRGNIIANVCCATIAGGYINNAFGAASVVAGGSQNTANPEWSAIGGGNNNFVNANGNYANIPGGDHLIAQSYAQTVIGAYNNNAVGTSTGTSDFMNSSHMNDRIFVIGNGTATNARHNAFEVSNNGHSIVYDQNGIASGVSGRPSIKGATYNDNIIYAWGKITESDISASLMTLTGTIPLGNIGWSTCATCNNPDFIAMPTGNTFGVQSITLRQVGSGGAPKGYEYLITLSITDATGTAVDLSGKCSITATPLYSQITSAFSTDDANWVIPPSTESILVSNMITGNQFKVWVYSTCSGSGCTPAELPFMFKVTGRP